MYIYIYLYLSVLAQATICRNFDTSCIASNTICGVLNVNICIYKYT